MYWRRRPRSQPGFSFGAAVFSWAHAVGCKEPSQHAPDTFIDQLKKLVKSDPELAMALSRTCKGGQELAFSVSEKLTFVSNINTLPTVLVRRNERLARRIKQRAPLTTGLRLTGGVVDAFRVLGAALWHILLQRQVTALRQGCGFDQQSARTITRLYLNSFAYTESHSVLRHLLPTLKCVTQITLEDALTKGWLALILQHLPRAEELRVRSIEVSTLAAAQTQSACQWARLIITGGAWYSKGVCAKQLALVPLPDRGRELCVEVPADGYLSVSVSTLGIDASVAARLSRWRFTAPCLVVVQPAKGLLATAQSAALLLAIAQLAAIQVRSRELILYDWSVTPQLLEAVATTTLWRVIMEKCRWPTPPSALISHALPTLDILNINHEPLTDGLISLLITHCPMLGRLVVAGLVLKTSHAHRIIERLEVLFVCQRKVDPAQFGLLPFPRHAPCAVVTGAVVDAPRLLLMPHITLTSPQIPTDVIFVTAQPRCATLPARMRITAAPTLAPAAQPAALQSVLAQVNMFNMHHVTLFGFTYTSALDTTLSSSPGQFPDMRVAIPGTLCSPAALPLTQVTHTHITEIELVGMAGAAGGGAAGTAWPLSVRLLVPIAARMAGPGRLLARDAVLTLDLESESQVMAYVNAGIKDVPVVLTYSSRDVNHVTSYLIRPPTQATFTPASPAEKAAAQAQAMKANCAFFSRIALPTPGFLRLDKWTVTESLVHVLKHLPHPTHAVVISKGVTWPDAATHAGAALCHSFGDALPSAPNIDWVVYGSCGVAELAHAVIGRTRRGAAGKVHVITADDSFAANCACQVYQRNSGLLIDVCACAGMPALPLRKPSTPQEQAAADKAAGVARYTRAQIQARQVAAALTAQADAAAAQAAAACVVGQASAAAAHTARVREVRQLASVPDLMEYEALRELGKLTA